MQGKILTYDKITRTLPELLSWRLLRTDGDGCDGFAVSFVADGQTDSWLAKAVEFFAFDGSRQVFCGIVDDYELSLTGKGRICVLSGRGMAGRLLDNEAAPVEYSMAYLPVILSNYVTALGVKSNAVALPPISAFSVPLGTSYWNVLRGFCINAGAKPPWCSAEGVVQVARQFATTTKSFSEAQILSASYCNCRYGVISKQMQITADGAVMTAVNDGFAAIGGCAQKVSSKTGGTLSCNYRSPIMQIEASKMEQFRLKLEMAGSFLAEPNTWVRVSMPSLGIAGSFRVCQCASAGSAEGITCTLTLSRV